MLSYYMFLAPEKGEPYRFVTGMKRWWPFWRRVEYSLLPVKVDVEDYAQLDRLRKAVEKDTGRDVKVCLADKMEECCGDNLFWAVIDNDGGWYTGKWYSKSLRRTAGHGGRLPETSEDIRECQLFVREHYAEEARLIYARKGFKATVVPVYVNTYNEFCEPCIVTLCVNKRTCAVRYLKSYKRGDHRLRYTDSLDDAMLIYPEQMDEVYEYLSSNHKELSFTMIVRPKANLAASEVKKHEAELIQRMTVDYYIGKKR